MSVPLVKKLSCGTLAIIARGDDKPWYVGPYGKKYSRTCLLFLRKGRVDPYEIPKCAWDKLVECLQDPEIKEKMKDWK